MMKMQKQLEKEARASAAAVVAAMDYDQLFGAPLMDRTQKIAGWRDPILDALQRKIVNQIKNGR